MRKLIIDTDTGADDAVALLMAASCEDVEILGITTVAGNVPLKQATANALASIEAAGRGEIPVYEGAAEPLDPWKREMLCVHGTDGLGDCGLRPAGTPQAKDAISYILETIQKYPGEVELIALGPATNVALAIQRDRETMGKLKCIWSMGTTGFGRGNATPVAEFNVYMDAQAYGVMLDSGISIYIAGLDLCTPGTGFLPEQLETLKRGNAMGQFAEKATRGLRTFYYRARGIDMVDLPDPTAVACALWDGILLTEAVCHGRCCTGSELTHGQVIFYEQGRVYDAMPETGAYNCHLITKMDEPAFMTRLMNLLTV